MWLLHLWLRAWNKRLFLKAHSWPLRATCLMKEGKLKLGVEAGRTNWSLGFLRPPDTFAGTGSVWCLALLGSWQV